MYLRLSVIGLALLLGAGGPGAWAAGKPRDACFSEDASPDETIAGCNTVLKQRKRETTSNVVNAFYNRGNAYVTKGETERAIKDFSEAITLDPSNPDSFHSRGSAFDDLERYDLALSDYEQALKLDPKRVITLVFRGITFKKMGELGKAISDFDAAIALAPKRGFTYYSRGLAYETNSDPVRALADLETAARLEPDDEDVQAALKRVRAVVQARPAASAAPAIAPLAMSKLLFVSRKAAGFGDVAARPTSAFPAGETLLVYIEPTGETIKRDASGLGVVRLKLDYEILGPSGARVGKPETLVDGDVTTDKPGDPDLYINSSIDLEGASPGAYTLIFTLYDKLSERTIVGRLPFTLVPPTVAPSAGQGNPAQAAATAPPSAKTDGPCATDESRKELIAAVNASPQFQNGRTQLTMLIDPETLLHDPKGRKANCRYTSVWAEKQADGGTAERRMKMIYKIAVDEKGESEVAYEFEK